MIHCTYLVFTKGQYFHCPRFVLVFYISGALRNESSWRWPINNRRNGKIVLLLNYFLVCNRTLRKKMSTIRAELRRQCVKHWVVEYRWRRTSLETKQNQNTILKDGFTTKNNKRIYLKINIHYCYVIKNVRLQLFW